MHDPRIALIFAGQYLFRHIAVILDLQIQMQPIRIVRPAGKAIIIAQRPDLLPCHFFSHILYLSYFAKNSAVLAKTSSRSESIVTRCPDSASQKSSFRTAPACS